MNFVVLGDPIAHSRSPAIHTAALEACGIEGSYVARRVDASGVVRAIEEIRAGELDGANVTMPHKRTAAAAADRLDDLARRAGSVNTLARSGNAVVGHTTDVGGILDAWGWAGLPGDRPALILGTGGAAAAALIALEGRELAIAGRRPGAGTELAAAVGVGAQEVAWGEMVRGAVVVNATPVGSAGESQPPGVIEHAAGYFEMVYAGGTTRALDMAREQGIPCADGLSLLVAQAARSFRIWTGIEAPIGVMRAAAVAA